MLCKSHLSENDVRHRCWCRWFFFFLFFIFFRPFLCSFHRIRLSWYSHEIWTHIATHVHFDNRFGRYHWIFFLEKILAIFYIKLNRIYHITFWSSSSPSCYTKKTILLSLNHITLTTLALCLHKSYFNQMRKFKATRSADSWCWNASQMYKPLIKATIDSTAVCVLTILRLLNGIFGRTITHEKKIKKKKYATVLNVVHTLAPKYQLLCKYWINAFFEKRNFVWRGDKTTYNGFRSL